MRARRPRSRGDVLPNTNRGPPQHFGLRHLPVSRANSSSAGTDSTPSEQVDLMAVSAMSLADAQTLAEKDHPGARASRPHKTWHDRRESPNGGLGALCKRVAVDGRLFAGIRMRAGRPRSRGDVLPNTNRGPPQHFGLRHLPAACQLLQCGHGFDLQRVGRFDGRTAMSLADAQTLAEKDHPGARASRPHKTWHDRRESP